MGSLCTPAEVAALEREAADEAEATQAVLGKLQLAGHKRHESTKKQLALWDERLRQALRRRWPLA